MKARSKKPAGESRSSSNASSLSDLATWNSSSGLLQVIVDTPKGSPVKFKYDVASRCYTIAHILPPGAVFPFDFGSIPGTLAEDGDPLDLLILMEEPTFAGCLVPVRLIGVLEAKQTQDGRTNHNDRLIGAAFGDRGTASRFRVTPGARPPDGLSVATTVPPVADWRKRARQDSNLRLLPPEGSALSTELRARATAA